MIIDQFWQSHALNDFYFHTIERGLLSSGLVESTYVAGGMYCSGSAYPSFEILFQKMSLLN